MAHTNSLGSHRTRFTRGLHLTCRRVLANRLNEYTSVISDRPNTRAPAQQVEGTVMRATGRHTTRKSLVR